MVEISSIWSQVTPQAESIEMVQYSWMFKIAPYRVLPKTTLAAGGVPYFDGAEDPVLGERRAIVPSVLVIKYISNTVSLQNFQDRGDVSLVRSWLVKALDDIFVRINKAAVTHQDVGLPDILIGPSRAVVVGFRGKETRLRGGRMRNGFGGRRGKRRMGIWLR